MQLKRCRLVVADDHELFLKAVTELLAADFEVIKTVKDGSALLKAVATMEPDLVVVDIAMPHLNGIEAARLIHENYSAVRVVILTGHTDPDLIHACFEAGALAYVMKSRLSELPLAIRAALNGDKFLSPMLQKQPGNNHENQRQTQHQS